MKHYSLTPRAKRDVEEIWEHIADDNIAAANRVVDALESAIVKLARNPKIGHFREDLVDKKHRLFLVHSYLIVYRFESKPIQVVRVLHASRDVQSIMDLP